MQTKNRRELSDGDKLDLSETYRNIAQNRWTSEVKETDIPLSTLPLGIVLRGLTATVRRGKEEEVRREKEEKNVGLVFG